MAIKGYLNEIKFVEVLRIIGKLNGRLGVWNFAEGKQYECFFQNSQVVYLNYNGTNVIGVDEVKRLMLELSGDNNSYYAFQNDMVPSTSSSVISVPELLESLLSKTVASFSNEDELPNLQTRFETVNKINFPLQGELEDFWKKTISMLHEGCSGTDICNAFNYSEREVQEALYKLRTTGLIKPVRVFKTANPTLRTKILSRNLNKIANRNGITANVNQPQRELVTAESEAVNIAGQGFNNHVERPAPPTTYNQPVPATPGFLKGEVFAAPQQTFPAEVPAAGETPVINVTPSFEPLPTGNHPASAQVFENAPIQDYQPVVAQPPVTPQPSVQPQSAQNDNYNPLPSASNQYSGARGGLIKRMLNSLFR